MPDTNYKAEGRVVVGLSHPVVAKYNAPGGLENGYTDGRVLARLESYDINITTAGNNNTLRLNNVVAEDAGAVMTSGKLTLVTDHPLPETEDYIYGQPAVRTLTVGGKTYHYSGMSTEHNPPTLGVGVIVKFICNGVFSFAPTIFAKCTFHQGGDSAKTQGEQIDYQLRTFDISLARDDTDTKEWRYNIRDYFATESEAIECLHAIMKVAG